VVPYITPGYERVMAVRRVLRDFRKKHRFPPRLVLLVNHGIVALGATAEEALNVTLMAEKWARTLIGTYGGFGGPKFFTRSEAARIDTWPAEHYRRSLLTAGARTGRGRRR
jgi:ribulose-5-phosphate 4-epimerase/fuculose-1-phosphate aldolase